MPEHIKAQEAANVLKPGGEELTDEAVALFYKRTKEAMVTGGIDLPFPCVQGLQPVPNADTMDLEDREKYPDFYNFWIKGLYTTIAKSLNVKSQFSLPVFDPLALGLALGLPKIPQLEIPEIVASFAAPIPLALQLLDIKPPDIPKFAIKSLGLIIPELPKIDIPVPPVWLPDINFEPFGALHVMLNLQIGIPTAFFNLMIDLLKPDFWINLSFPGFFELACKTFTKPVVNSFIAGNPSAALTPPVTAIAAASALGVHTSDSAVFAGTSVAIGAGGVVQKTAEIKGYKPQAGEKVPSLYSEAALNGLQPFEPDPTTDGATWVFNKGLRNTFFGDPFTVEYLYELGKHMKKSFPDYTIEVGNITGKDDANGWRWSKWSTLTAKGGKQITSHYGSAFDFAYPMKYKGSRTSGMNLSSTIITGEEEGSPWSTPYRPNPAHALPSSGDYEYDFEVMYEILRWTREDFLPQIVAEGRLRNEPNNNTQFGNPKDYVFTAVVMGNEVGKRFRSWMDKNGKKQQRISPENSHEDHMHFRFCRTRLDTEATSARTDGKSCYLIPWKVEVLYGTQQVDSAPRDRAVEHATKTLPDGKKIKVVI